MPPSLPRFQLPLLGPDPAWSVLKRLLLGAVAALSLATLSYGLLTRSTEPRLRRAFDTAFSLGMPASRVVQLLDSLDLEHADVQTLQYSLDEWPAGSRVLFAALNDWRAGFRCSGGIYLRFRFDSEARLIDKHFQCLGFYI